jgi:hypothetical protein
LCSKALSGLGGGGKADAKTADNGNVGKSLQIRGRKTHPSWTHAFVSFPFETIALYSTFAVFGFFGGTIV